MQKSNPLLWKQINSSLLVTRVTIQWSLLISLIKERKHPSKNPQKNGYAANDKEES